MYASRDPQPECTNDPSGLALVYARRGLSVIDVPHRSKNPSRPGWQDERLTEADLRQRFSGMPRNLSVLLGEPSGGHTDVDLDALEVLALADDFLPATDSVFGRPGKRRSHREYVAAPIVSTAKFQDPLRPEAEGMLVELRSTGCHTLFPPSVHPTGETTTWERDGDPARIDGRILRRAVARLAVAGLLVRYYPGPGSRHDAMNALAGGLLRGGWGEDETVSFILAVARGAGDEEARDRPDGVRTTVRRLADDRKATGWPTLAALVGERVVASVCDWLEMRREAAVLEWKTAAAAPATRATPWPDPLAEEAYYGVVGDLVRAIEPHSEADPAAILAHVVTGVGACLGPNVQAMAGDAPHPPRLNAIVVGETAIGRKGSAHRATERGLALVDPAFVADRMTEGLSSGEGLIWQVRDPIYKWVKEKGGPPQEVLVDPGVDDKRLWLVESEFASVLRVGQREGNTLTAIIRRAWDRSDLKSLTKNSPAQATGAHVSIVGHISRDELLRYLDRSELASGFANRFLFMAARRARVLPDGEGVPLEALQRLAPRLREAAEWVAAPRKLVRDDEARAIWHDVYPSLSEGKPGMFGGATNRAAAQVLRLSVFYAALDCSPLITADHLLAALAVWRYAEQSARWVFGDAIGDPVADTILAALRRGGPLTRNDLVNLFDRHTNRARIDRALGLLLAAGLVRREDKRDTGGRPAELWHAV